MKKFFTPVYILFISIVVISVYFIYTREVNAFFNKEYGTEINGLQYKDKSKTEKIISETYNSDKSAYLRETTKRSLMVKSQSAMGRYLFVSSMIESILFFVLLWYILQMYKSIEREKSFNEVLDTLLHRMGILLFLLGGLTLINQLVISRYLSHSGFDMYKVRVRDLSYWFYAFLAFAFSRIYKSGKVLKQENDLTV